MPDPGASGFPPETEGGAGESLGLTGEEPRFRWGEPVLAAIDLVNDGSFEGVEPSSLIEPRGARGRVVRVGAIPDRRENVYLVEFEDGRVVGCFEREIDGVREEKTIADATPEV